MTFPDVSADGFEYNHRRPHSGVGYLTPAALAAKKQLLLSYHLVPRMAAGQPGLPLNPQNDPDLAAVIDAWPALPADVRKMIGGVVRATTATGKR